MTKSWSFLSIFVSERRNNCVCKHNKTNRMISLKFESSPKQNQRIIPISGIKLMNKLKCILR